MTALPLLSDEDRAAVVEAASALCNRMPGCTLAMRMIVEEAAIAGATAALPIIERAIAPGWQDISTLPDDFGPIAIRAAEEILNFLGVGHDASREPGIDWRRDKAARIIEMAISLSSAPEASDAS